LGRIRILFTIPNFITAGSGREMFNIIEHLDKKAFEPYIAVQQAGGALYDEITAKNYPVLVAPFVVDEKHGTIKKIAVAKSMASFFRPYKFQLWQSFNWSSDFTEGLVAKFAGAKFVYVKKNMNWDRLAWKVKSHLSDAIIARNTTLIENQLSSWHYKRKAWMIPGAVDLEKFGAKNPGLKQQLNLPSKAFVISCIAQLVKVKDQATLIKAVAKLNDVHLILAGAERDKEYATELQALIKACGLSNRVHITGPVSNIPDLLNITDIFVLPTTNRHGHEEGSPVALLEAMAANVPCIASDVAGSRDLVKHDKTGLLFQPENAEELAGCIKTYMDNPGYAKQLAANALQEVKELYTLEIEAEAFSKIYKALVKQQ
jgi:glycosyltransferase involved in cell wall biosynthesis